MFFAMALSENILSAVSILLLVANLSAGSLGALYLRFSDYHRPRASTESRSLQASSKLSFTKTRSRSIAEPSAEVTPLLERLAETRGRQSSPLRLGGSQRSRLTLLATKVPRQISKSVLNI
jgi:hypothetical protein